MALTRVHIQPNILRWAVERTGKNIDEYTVENPKYKEWLEGLSDPTFSMAEKFAHKFYVPFGYLFLPNPPEEKLPIPFFRRREISNQNINIHDVVIEMIDRQDWLSDYLHKNDFDKVAFVGKYHDIRNPEVLAKAIHQELHLPVNWAFSFKTVNDAINHIVQIMEDCGVIVTFNSMVGYNTKRPLSVRECRGFSLIDDYAPFIFINSKDVKGAQMFTLMHEFTHVLLGYSSGIGDLDEVESASELEKLCDKTAALTLVPQDLFANEWTKIPYRYDILTKRFKVSRYVIARRAAEVGYIQKEQMFQLYNKWNEEPLPEKKDGHADFKVLAVRRNSKIFLVHVCNALSNRQILYSDACRMIGLKGDTFERVVKSKVFLK
ncbi:MAG: ImmA/IrrE family metallo-endopeptidase [Prevotella sp.]|jgi:Zn-dependent peptidase ImmA (M78 family)|nr:ImmA/IrrE family metallo-endopeptidase [Prevotella sp.]MCH4018597.1 ImmA/IrrE family metallo-endopeptidase [Prevotella sp.]MCI1349565.1 ImmA/IrrE family metallo-endopeptidase [Prevotella sp.]